MSKIKYKHLLALAVIMFTLITSICLILSNGSNRSIKISIVFSFIIIIIVNFIGFVLASNNYSYSFCLMFCLFNLFFMGVAPLLQYLTNTYAWNFIASDSEILTANFYIILYLLSFFVGSKSYIKLSTDKRFQRCNSFIINNTVLDIFCILSFIFFIFKLKNRGFINLFTRGAIQGKSTMPQSLSLLKEYITLNTSLFSFVFSYLRFRMTNKHKFWFIFSGLTFVFSFFPFAMARNTMAVCYGGIFCVIFFDYIKNNRWFPLLLLIGLVLAFPAVNVFRYIPSLALNQDSDLLGMMLNMIQSTYLIGDYDAHQMIMSSMRYVQEYGFTWGKNLLGALLFFVPRSIWTSKPVGSGALVISGLKQHEFTNISSPFIAELFLSFGVVGICIGGFLLGHFVSFIDSKYWRCKARFNYLKVFYPFGMFMFFFFLRGDLMSSWAYTFALLIVSFCIFKMVFRFR